MSSATKVSNFSDLIQRVTASCLLNPLGSTRHADDDSVLPSPDDSGSDDDNYKTQEGEEEEEEDDEYHYADDDGGDSLKNWELKKNNKGADRQNPNPKCQLMINGERVVQMEMLIGEVFDAVSAMKRAYVSLQEAHCPWDPDKMRVADVAVVAELRRIGVLRERFRRSIGNGGGKGRGRWKVGVATLREVVAPYEAAVEDLKREVKAKEVEIENLREKFKTASSLGSGGKKSGSKSRRKVGCSSQGQIKDSNFLLSFK